MSVYVFSGGASTFTSMDAFTGTYDSLEVAKADLKREINSVSENDKYDYWQWIEFVDVKTMNVVLKLKNKELNLFLSSE